MERQEAKTVIETEELVVDDKPVTVDTLADGTISVAIPEGLTGEDREKFIAAVNEKSSTVGTFYKKLHDLNKDKAEWEEFKRKDAEAEHLAPNTGAPAERPKGDSLWQKLGLASEDDLQDYIIDHPVEYANALREHITAEVSLSTQEQMRKQQAELERSTLDREVQGAGYDPKEVQAFARFYQMPYGSQAFELYRLKHAPQTDPVVQARIASQQKQINYVETGQRRIRTSQITREVLKSLPAEELDQVLKDAMELASR